MTEIRGDAKNIRTLLRGAKFAIDDYQREYRWETTQVTELIDDLTEKFLESHETGNERDAIERYGHYFLGSIIISDKKGQKFIVDGQQRLTSLTLILIHLYHQTGDDQQKRELAGLINSYQVGRSSYNLDIPERNDCMEALFKNQPFDDTDKPESVVNIVKRFQEIEDSFPKELTGETLPYFADWLIENVHLVEITAYSDSDAYTIFESMNDRGLSLSHTDMLKGYLLNEITDENIREKARGTWRERVKALKQLDGKNNDADAIKAWLRSQYAETISIRDEKRSTQPGDFYLIGSGFYRWVRNNEKEKLSLETKADFGPFIQKNFNFYVRQYERIYEATTKLEPKLEAIYYNNAWSKFTLQYPVLLAPLRLDDSDDEIRSKLRIVANYLDILIARRIWNGRNITHSTMLHELFDPIILGIRRKPITELVEFLIDHLAGEKETFKTNPSFRKNRRNGRQIHQLLARMLDYIETNSGRESRYLEYTQPGQNGYEIEHIWANKHERHSDEFPQRIDFEEYRNRIGGLLLLPKKFNASYGNMPYAEKLEYYYGENLLARSLNKKAYDHDSGFSDFCDESGLKFEKHPEFKRVDLDKRQELYRNIAEQVWNPENLRKI